MKKIKLNESLEIHSQLNPKLYNESNLLKEDVLEALKNIANEFIEDLRENNIPLNVVDIWLVGSNASYNYSNKSDIDVHIIANFEGIDCDKNILNLLYNYVKSDFNKNYNIKVKGMDVEVYIEDMNTTSITNGVYSILHNEWIKFPSYIKYPIELQDIDVKNTDLFNIFYNQYLSLDTIDDIQDFINRLYILRKSSLINEGEFGLGNLIFKEFRNLGILDELKERKRFLKSKELTLEKLNGFENTNLSLNPLKEDQSQEGIIAYHGSFKDFDSFDSSKIGQHDAGQMGEGIYFFSDPKAAGFYGNKIYKCKLNIKNPYMISLPIEDEFVKDVMEEGSHKATENIKSKGYDSIILKDDIMRNPNKISEDPVICDQICILDPSIIKIINRTEVK